MRGSVFLLVLLLVTGCGTNESYVTKKYQTFETWQLCKRMLEGDMASWKIPWANNVIRERGESCEKYIGKFKPVPQIEIR